MNHLTEQQKVLSRDIFKKVIEKKIALNVNARDICKTLDIDDEDAFSYFAGEDTLNLPLGIKILDYLEKCERNKEI